MPTYGLRDGRTNSFGIVGVICFAFLALCSSASSGLADRSPAELCDRSAQAAAAGQSVPLDVMRAITRAETGRPANGLLQPWPWTVNMEGVGHWFPDREAAQAYVNSQVRRGARSFDVGCFQINYKWHGQAFRSVDEMFDPGRNAAYAARFLAELHAEFGDWSRAVGAYHSRTPELARRYAARFEHIRRAVSSVPVNQVITNFGPPGKIGLGGRLAGGALIGDGMATNGSLVPIFGASSVRPLFVPPGNGS